MSQFGGGKPPGQWHRPAAPGGAPQLSGFPTVNFGGVPMVGMGSIPMGMVNQAAFSSPNVLGMQGIMGAVPQQSLAQQQPTLQQQNGLQQGANLQQNAGARNQRTFVGVVTKMLDTYGFVDDDVFFQHSVIRGAHPRVGDKVMVEANYNPSMPFKWNAYRIQLLNAATQQEPVRQAQPQQQLQQQQQQQRGAQESQRWGASNTGGNDRDRNGGRGNESPLHRSAQPRRHSPPARRASPPRRASPKRDTRPARDSREPREAREPRRSPPPRRVSPKRAASPTAPARTDRKRERSPSGSVAPSIRRDSASPPRRRARIIPRYECRVQKPAILGPVISASLLRHRYNKLYLPSDCVDLSFEWVRSVQLDMSLDLNNPIQFHVFNKDVEYIGEPLPEFEPEDSDHRHQVKVLLLSHAGKSEVVKKSFCLMADGTTDDHQEPQSLLKNLHFIVGARGKETMGIGGSWSPSLDGADPNSATTMIRTAVRTTRALTGIDLSSVSQWFTMVQIRYYRADKQRIDHVNFLLPDTQSLALDDAKWAEAEQQIGEQLKAKLAEVDAMKIEEEEVVKKEENVVEMVDAAPEAPAVAAVVAPEAEVKKEEEETKDEPHAKVEDADVSMTSENGETPAVEAGQGPTNWSKLDPKSMKVAELRVELESRGLETKGIKTLLVQRLQTALDAEKSTEAAAAKDVEMKDVSEAAVKQESGEENPAAFIAPPIEETKAKTEAEAKKEQEEADKRKKKEEQLEKEKKEKREALEKHYQLPKDKKILVFPSKTFKSGKFDCKILSLSSLLDYRHDDNKESQFEVSLFAEAFKEMIERNAAFTIYETLVNCGDKDAEKKRRDEAREKTVEVPAEKAAETAEKPAEDGAKTEEQKEEKKDDKAEKKEEEKKEKKERVEVKSVVANRTVYEAFSLFDSNLCGYLTEKDIEDILHNGEFGISRGQVQKLAKKLSVREKINYRHLTDVLTDLDGNVRHTPGGADDVVETDDLIRGFGLNLAKSLEPVSGDSSSSAVSASSDGVVIINGSAVNVVQKLKMLKQLEKERDDAKATVNEQISLIEQLREAKADIEKKKKDIDSHYHKSNKKLNETTAQLKTTQDDNSTLKQALQDCKRHADRVFSVVEKAMPAPKKEEKKEEKKKEEKASSSSSSSSEKKDSEKEKSAEKTDEVSQDGAPEAAAETIAVDEVSEEKDEVEDIEEVKA